MKKFALIFGFLAFNLTASPQSFAQPLTLTDPITQGTISAYQASYFAKGLHETPCPDKSKGLEYKAIPYCFTDDGVAEIRTINGTSHLFLKFNADFAQDAGHATSGLGGLYVFKANAKDEWQLVAKNPYIENGQWGESQLKDFELVKVGSQKYGWAGEFEGSGAGGESNSLWTLFAPIGEKILPILEEETAHNYTGGGTDGHWIETTGKVTILSTHPEVNGYYPIQVTRTTKTAPTNDDGKLIKSKIKTKNENYTLIFNGRKFVKQ